MFASFGEMGFGGFSAGGEGRGVGGVLGGSDGVPEHEVLILLNKYSVSINHRMNKPYLPNEVHKSQFACFIKYKPM